MTVLPRTLDAAAKARLHGVRVVLVEPSHPGNIGATARAMRTMGLRRLHLVAGADHLGQVARERASGAEDVLAAATTHDDLDQALVGCHWVVGASARLRSLPWPALDPRDAARRLMSLPAGSETAMVFGRERSGLSNAELERCNALLHIPSDFEFGSLNLAAAVQVCSYELRMALLQDAVPSPAPDQPASAEALAALHQHLYRVLVGTGFLRPERPGRVMRRLRRLLVRAAPERTEVDILRGILSAVEASMERRSGAVAGADSSGDRRPGDS